MQQKVKKMNIIKTINIARKTTKSSQKGMAKVFFPIFPGGVAKKPCFQSVFTGVKRFPAISTTFQVLQVERPPCKTMAILTRNGSSWALFLVR